MYQLLIFDWDGTVIDSTGRIVTCMQAAARDLNMAELSDDVVMNIIGLGLPEAIRTMIPGIDDEGVQALRERYGYYFMGDRVPPCELFPGVEEALYALREQGYRLAVATGKSRRGLDKAFAETGIGHLFETSRCADETRSKPHPLMLEEILAETGVASRRSLMIGDTEYDLEMGRNAGMDTIAVSYGAHHLDRLTPYKPVLQAHQFSDLNTWLAQFELAVED